MMFDAINSFLATYDSLFILGSVVLLALAYFIPLNRYKIPVQVLLFAFCGYLLYASGETNANNRWKAKVAAVEQQIKILENKANTVTVQTVTKYVDKIKYVDRVQVQTVKEFVTVVDDSACRINNGFVRLYDAQINNEVIKPADTDSAPSDAKLSDIAETNKKNSIIHKHTEEQLKSLQNWVLEQENLWSKKSPQR